MSFFKRKILIMLIRIKTSFVIYRLNFFLNFLLYVYVFKNNYLIHKGFWGFGEERVLGGVKRSN